MSSENRTWVSDAVVPFNPDWLDEAGFLTELSYPYTTAVGKANVGRVTCFYTVKSAQNETALRIEIQAHRIIQDLPSGYQAHITPSRIHIRRGADSSSAVAACERYASSAVAAYERYASIGFSEAPLVYSWALVAETKHIDHRSRIGDRIPAEAGDALLKCKEILSRTRAMVEGVTDKTTERFFYPPYVKTLPLEMDMHANELGLTTPEIYDHFRGVLDHVQALKETYRNRGVKASPSDSDRIQDNPFSVLIRETYKGALPSEKPSKKLRELTASEGMKEIKKLVELSEHTHALAVKLLEPFTIKRARK